MDVALERRDHHAATPCVWLIAHMRLQVLERQPSDLGAAKDGGQDRFASRVALAHLAHRRHQHLAHDARRRGGRFEPGSRGNRLVQQLSRALAAARLHLFSESSVGVAHVRDSSMLASGILGRIAFD